MSTISLDYYPKCWLFPLVVLPSHFLVGLLLPLGVNCFTVAATTSDGPSAIKDTIIGDGLVPLKSALGQHDEATHCLDFAASKQWTAYGTSHMALLSRPDVGAQVLKWLGQA